MIYCAQSYKGLFFVTTQRTRWGGKKQETLRPADVRMFTTTYVHQYRNVRHAKTCNRLSELKERNLRKCFYLKRKVHESLLSCVHSSRFSVHTCSSDGAPFKTQALNAGLGLHLEGAFKHSNVFSSVGKKKQNQPTSTCECRIFICVYNLCLCISRSTLSEGGINVFELFPNSRGSITLSPPMIQYVAGFMHYS